MQAFVYNALPARVVFGHGTLAALPAEAERLGLENILVLSTPEQEGQAASVADRLGGRAAAVFAGAAMHTPVEVTDEAMAMVADNAVDGTVAIGGGSTIGLGKAIALRTELPQIAVPTTYAGSEMTPIIGQTAQGEKTTQRSLRVLPETVIYDVELTLSLPVALSSTSGINAMAHAVEALYAEDRNPIVALMAEEGIRSLATALPRIKADAADTEARADALYSAWLCGTCLGSVGMALHHKLCHTLGGSFDLPHAQTHTIVLPHAVAYNANAAAEAMTAIARALGAGSAAQGLYDLAQALEAPLALKDLGMPEDGIDRAAELAVQNLYWNPRKLEHKAIRELIAQAWAGARPAS